MEIYSSSQTKQKAQKPREIYYSRTKLIVGAVIWTLASAFFGALTARLAGETGILVVCGLMTLCMLWMLYGCIRGLLNVDKPALIIGREGIRFADGLLIAWEDIEENTYYSQSYMGIPTLKLIQIKTTLKKPKVKKMRVAALDIDSDEYLELCDAYSQSAALREAPAPVPTRR
ncbi:hypothetical protein [Comamonas sp. JC664]|uniref:hypothetical protein n=1 Tax=Comamonas sp. JC664 TaxID=2801917 RepID=UPI00174DD5A4|nr:hypothetical protein [Comamonas sp. JC664]MBL0693935.1 hypothetical protein [Comamonas sp. JC664]GHH03796.1 hypothetical protein GCM10012319_72800 [Comamonas sp. KCTC 72670]